MFPTMDNKIVIKHWAKENWNPSHIHARMSIVDDINHCKPNEYPIWTTWNL